MKMKRFLAMLIILNMILTMLPSGSLSAMEAGQVTYQPAVLKYSVMPAAIAQNADFLNLSSTRNCGFNHIYRFLDDKGSRKFILFDTVYTRLQGRYTYDLGALSAAGQLSVSYTLSMQNYHYGLFKDKRQWPSTELYEIRPARVGTDWNLLFEHTGARTSPDKVCNYGSSTYFSDLSADTTQLCLDFNVDVEKDKGDANVRDLTVYVADRLKPTLEKISYLDDSGKEKNAFKAGETVTIVLTFNENIRFSDNSPNHNDVQLALNVAKRSTKSTNNVSDQFAVLTELTGKQLIFAYTVPDTLDDSQTDHYITGIKGLSSQTTWYQNTASFDLVYPNAYKADFLPSKAAEYGFNKTYSLITDLAGNPVAPFKDKGSASCYLDNVAPLINSVTVSGNMITDKSEENEAEERCNDALYAGVGDWLQFKAWFSEKVVITGNLSGITAKLNITTSDGSARATLAGATASEENGVTTVTFNKLEIKEGMKPLESGTVKFITLESIDLTSTATVADPAGNAFTGQILRENGIVADKQERLDTLTPAATTNATESEGKFTPSYIEQSASVARIYFPITIEDDYAHGDDYVSGVNGTIGSFCWQSPSAFNFDYCVTSTAAEPTDGWKTASANTDISFQQVVTTSGGNYIHLRPSTEQEIKDTSLIIYPTDYAGNISSGVPFPLNYTLDVTGPVITKTSLNNYSDPETESGYIETDVKITDPSTVDVSSIKYQWVKWSGNTSPETPAASDSKWVAYSDSGLSDAETVDISFTLSDLEKGVPHRYMLFIKASDLSSVGAQTSITGLECSFDLGYPDFKISPSTAPASQVQMYVSPPGDDGETTVGCAVIMVKDPWNTSDSSKYFVRRVATSEPVDIGGRFDLFDKLYYQNGCTEEMKNWIYCTVREDTDGAGFVFTDPITVYDLMSIDIPTAKRLLAIMGVGTSGGAAYYGDVDVTVITGYGDLSGNISSTTNVLVRDFTLKSAYPGAVYYQGGEAPADTNFQLMLPYAVHTITLSSDDENLHPENTWTNPNSGAKYLSSMDGIILRVDISNSIIPNWGITDARLDGTNSRIELYRVSSPDVADSNILQWSAPLTGASQSFSIPSTAFDYSGEYELRTSVCSVGGNRTDTTSDFIYIDKSSPHFDCGLAYSDHKYNYLSHHLNHRINYGYDQDVIYLGEQPDKAVSLTFGIDNSTAREYDEEHVFGETFIRAWNATEGNETQDRALWHSFPVGDNSICSYRITYADTITVTDTASVPKLCLLSKCENIVCYQIATTTGYLSPVHTVTVNTSKETAAFDMALTPETSDKALSNATAYVQELSGSASMEMTVNELTITGDNVQSVPLTSDTIQITDNDPHHYYVTNLYGNFSFATVQADYVDCIKPLLEGGYTHETEGGYSPIDEGNTFNAFYLDLYDDRIFDPAEMQLYLKLNDTTYMNKLKNDYGLELNEQGYFKVALPSLPINEEFTTWLADSASNNGIWKIQAQRWQSSGLKKDYHCVRLFINICKPYEHGGSDLNTTLSAYAVDIAGNFSASDENIVNIRLTNREAKFSSYEVSYSSHCPNVNFAFEAPVLMTSPIHLLNGSYRAPSAKNGYGFSLLPFPAWVGGNYSITYQDVFGVETTEIVEIENSEFYTYGLEITYSDTMPTQENVVVKLRSTNPGVVMITPDFLHSPPNPPVEFTLPDGTPVTNSSNYYNELDLTFTDNTDIYLSVRQPTLHGSYYYETIRIPIYNMIARAPDADVSYYYHEFCLNELPAGKTSTEGLVTAYLSSSDSTRTINGVNCSLEYTFPYGTKAGTSYTFTYSDNYGNTGTKIVTCPVEILTPTAPEPDTLSPTYNIWVYGGYNGVYQKLETWYGNIWEPQVDGDGNITDFLSIPSTLNTTDNFANLIQQISYTGGYQLEFKITDASRTKMVLLPESAATSGLTFNSAQSTAISGVTINGNWITVDEGAGAFKVVIIDEHDNFTAMDFSDSWLIDTISPVIEDTAEVKLGYSKTRIFLQVTDANTALENVITAISPSGLLQIASTDPIYGVGGTSGTDYTGWYYYDYTTNETVNFKFRDTSYNTASKSITISDLDISAPKSTVAWWSPSASNDPKIAPTAKTNRNVSVGLEFDKTIRDLTLTFDNGTDYVDSIEFGSEPATVSSLSPTSAVITFTSGASIRATYTSLNGMTGTRDLTLGEVIDKAPPVIDVIITNDEPTKTKATITLRPEEDVRDKFNKVHQAGTSMEHTIFTRGTYYYTFTDDAGNITTVAPAIENIDEMAPAIIFNDLPDPSDPNYYTKEDVSFQAAMNEPGSIYVDGELLTDKAQGPVDSNSNGEIEIDEWNWHNITVSCNGSYGITAIDVAGRKTTSYVSIDCFDNTAPIITLSPSPLRIRQGTLLSELTNNVLLNGVAVSDNVSPLSKITFTVNHTLTQNDLNTLGVYEVEITATDEAGNSTTATRYLKVYAKNELDVKINGIKADHGGTTGVSGTAVNIEVDLPPSFKGEPYTVFYREGLKTAGQMKNNATVLAPAAGLTDSYTFTASAGGFYTIYIVRQDREAFLTKIYVQQ
ncbi:MAG: hypothetical protein PHV56_01510 [Clostridia bacterium]|nr:hypothetical protein [Clostridia bacterium]